MPRPREQGDQEDRPQGRPTEDAAIGTSATDPLGQQAIDQNLVKALAHPLRVRILEALQGRAASPTELAKQFKQSLGVVSYHTNVLLEVDCIEPVRTRPRRGTIEHFYTAKPRSFIGHQEWRRAPLSVRGGVTDHALSAFVTKVAAALEADTIDQRPDTTLNWMPIAVDKKGWRDTAEILDRARRELMEVAAASRERLGGEDGIPVVTGLAAFEAPPRKADEGP